MEAFASILTNGKPASWEMKQGVGMMFLHYNMHGLIGNSNVMEMLLGRKPLTYKDWVKLVVKEAKGQ